MTAPFLFKPFHFFEFEDLVFSLQNLASVSIPSLLAEAIKGCAFASLQWKKRLDNPLHTI